MLRLGKRPLCCIMLHPSWPAKTSRAAYMQDRVAFCNFIISQDGGDSFMLKLFEPCQPFGSRGHLQKMMNSGSSTVPVLPPAYAIQGCMAVAIWKSAAY